MKYGLFTYGYSNNIGDEVQSIAAEGFLPRTDLLIERDRFQWYAANEPTFVIFNGWFTREPCWPPPPSLKPLFVSFYAHRAEELIKKEHAAYFNAHGPIGCRSLATAEAFKKIGVDAYFSGCLTLTIPNTGRGRTDKIYALDVEPDLYSALVPQHIRERALNISNDFPRVEASLASKAGWNSAHFLMRVLNKINPGRTLFAKSRKAFESYKHDVRMGLARARLQALGEASLVVTSRLHCAMPCLAMGTPVVLLRRGVETDPRFDGLWQLVRHGGDASKPVDIDWNNPGPNPDNYLEFANALKKRCRDTVGQIAGAEAQPAAKRAGQTAPSGVSVGNCS